MGRERWSVVSSEVAADATYCRASADNADINTVPIGRPITNTQVYLLNPYLQPVAVGAPGEIYVGGDGLSRGYHRRPGMTAAKFIPDAFGVLPGGRLYKTGDLGRYKFDGKIEYLGRTDQQVKIRGNRIELGEIEALLTKHHAVKAAAVGAVESGTGGKRLTAYLVFGDKPATTGELRGFLSEKLPEYMIPSAFVALDELPLTPNGKINRKQLESLAASPAETVEDFAPPRDVIEFQLTQIWEEILGVKPVPVNKNFFELGGNSLMSVVLIANIQKRFGLELPLTALLEGATVERLAGRISEEPSSLMSSPIVGIRPSGSKPPLFCVHPAGGSVLCYVRLARHLDPDRPIYALQSPGLYCEREPLTTIEQMASYYIEAVRTIQPQGPYFLTGWSMGGMVAYEMARQLEAGGETIGLLALLDTQARFFKSEPALMSRTQTLLNMLEGIPLEIPDQFHKLEFEAQLKHVLDQARKHRSLPESMGLSQIRAMIDIYRTNLFAMDRYERRPFPGRITLFSAGDEADPTRGWEELAEKELRVITLPGTHKALLNKPTAQILAQGLNDCLSKAGEEVIETGSLTISAPGSTEKSYLLDCHLQ
ncbi:MAG: hypothetical protein DMF60_02765 [Acidobacteria bacterium]|nr:MAG: hypothetical protein DMF60_02765 [Acidobacteriota bacterium]